MSDEPSPIRILVADDHPIVCEGIVNLVGGQSDMRVIGEASNGRKRSSSSEPSGRTLR
jgi:DNA-binding NarL/FixJ family response regulator